ncbi:MULTISPECIES: MraY family glycosyltransferase [unclassified Diaminobutyricimonas]|uniref:glycosyltransferase family 4 protein n=1 Tax=unclassified Diaminobutyricimonas TaxID=2643261 RepID=UPI0012F513FE|nr:MULTISPECIES: MraY family glycosyltransferase [unclassified Diaminobutyricimonas]
MLLTDILDLAGTVEDGFRLPRTFFYALVGLITAVVTFALSFLIWKLSMKYRLYPKIRARDVHTTPTPRLGGIAMFIGILAGFGVASQLPTFSLVFAEPLKVVALLGSALIIVLLGVADDIWDLDWVTKLAGQIIAAGVLAWQIQLVSLPFVEGVALVSPFTSLVLTVFVVVLVMNAVNFIDGLDGLVAGVALIANAIFFIYAYILQLTNRDDFFNLSSLISVAVMGACFGFLFLNWHPAKLFMGDAGALLVGLLMAASAISVTGRINPTDFAPDRSSLLPALMLILLPFAILILPLLDFGLAIIRRLRAGKSPFSADRKHLHHRLLDMGHSHFHAVLIFYAWTAVVAVGCLLFMFLDILPTLIIIAVGLAICTAMTLAPLSRRKRTEAAAQLAAPDAPDATPAHLDPLDAASTGSIDIIHKETPAS